MKYLFSIVFALSLFISVSAKADSNNSQFSNTGPENILTEILDFFGFGHSSNNTSPSNKPSNNPGTAAIQTNAALPINNEIVFLTIAGIMIGVTVIKRKNVALVPIKAVVVRNKTIKN
jgi:hypothetical protein